MKPTILLFVQFSLIALIILTGQIVPKQLPFLSLFVFGIVIAGLAITNNSKKQVKNSFLSSIQTLRHPFYTSSLLLTLSLVLDLYTYERLVMWIALFVVVLMRLQQKERGKKRKKSKQTAKNSYRLIPFIY